MITKIKETSHFRERNSVLKEFASTLDKDFYSYKWRPAKDISEEVLLSFDPQSVFRMLDLDEDVVTGVYPRKVIDWTRAIKKVKDNPNIKEDELHAASLQYNLNIKNPKKVIVNKGIIEVLDGATGFMLIKRNVFKKMALAYPHLRFKSDQHLGDPHDKTFGIRMDILVLDQLH